MLPNNMQSCCKEAFLELVFQTSKYHNRTYCYFEPFKAKNVNYHITIVDKETGYGTVIPISMKSMMLLEKADMKEIYHRLLAGVLVAIEKHKEHASPVDYRKNPLTASKHQSIFETIEKSDKVKVEIYSWSKLILG